ncbi:EAL domain-containing protein [Clostridium sp.]|uniref:EAL domain-containing protein n=1 Tax=Clostridium sp. TaxID=1506 RepID=UPI003D6CC120
MKLINCLYKAIERNEFELYYQPQVSVISGKIIGLEALIRWNSAELGRVSPVDFIHISEKTGLILPIGEWVLKAACSQNKKGMTMEYLMYQ